MANVDYAIEYAKMGLAVFPVKPNDKTPLTVHGCKDATTNEATIHRMWNRCPDANIGIATGMVSGGICVVDVDINEEKGIDGMDSIVQWERENSPLPTTVTSITGRGGYHYLYRFDGEMPNRTNVLQGVDFRGDGGYIVAPPSVHKNGREYEWEYDPEEYSIASADDVVLSLLKRPESEKGEVQKLDIKAMITEGGRNDGLYRVACHYQSLFYGDDEIRVLLHNANEKCCNPPLDKEEVDKILSSALGLSKGKSEEYKKKRDKNHQTIDDMVECIEADEDLRNAIRYNSLAYSPWVAGKLPWSDVCQREWTDVDDANFYAYMQKYGFSNKENMQHALTIVMDKKQFSPIREHLECIKGTWDGVKRVDTLLQDFLGADDTELNRNIMRLFMYGAIKRAYHPGCQFDYMLILVGDQGIGKSTFLRKLSMRDIWFDGNFNTIEGSQAVERLRGMWILEMSELLAMKRSKEVEAMKSFVTNRADNYRVPYTKRTISRMRQCVFAGTTNDDHFLTDTTGNRRFMPVRTHADQVKRNLFDKKVVDYFEQAWAEALHDYFETNPELVLSKSAQAEMLDVQEGFAEEDVWVGMIEEYLNETTISRTCVIDIWENALHGRDKPMMKESNRIHSILKNNIVGWHSVGRKRCSRYGTQRCYDRDFDGWSVVAESEQVPF